MTKSDKLLIDQMFALGEQLIKKATELKSQSGGVQAGSRKGRREEMRKKVVGKLLKTALRS